MAATRAVGTVEERAAASWEAAERVRVETVQVVVAERAPAAAERDRVVVVRAAVSRAVLVHAVGMAVKDRGIARQCKSACLHTRRCPSRRRAICSKIRQRT